jgi:hypothetical protein
MSTPVRNLNNFAGDMPRRACAHRRIVELSRLRFRECNQFLHVVRREHWDARPESAGIIAARLIDAKSCSTSNGSFGIELGIDRVRGQREQQRVAISRRLCRDVGADVAGGATAIVDDDRLAQFRGQGSLRMRATTSVPPPGG